MAASDTDLSYESLLALDGGVDTARSKEEVQIVKSFIDQLDTQAEGDCLICFARACDAKLPCDHMLCTTCLLENWSSVVPGKSLECMLCGQDAQLLSAVQASVGGNNVQVENEDLSSGNTSTRTTLAPGETSVEEVER